MSDISQEIAAIQSASRGSEVRSPIVDALNKMNAATLPAVTSSDSKKLLCVNAQGQWVASNEQYVPTPTGTLNISENGTYNVVDKASAVVNVQGGITPTGTIQITQNGTYDVTNKASAEVNVQGSSPVLVPKTITQNGTYDPEDDNADGYSEVTVNVSGGGGGLDGIYSPIPDSRVTISSGSIVVRGNHAILCAKVNNATFTNAPFLTVPSAIKPAGMYYGYADNGGSLTKIAIWITPNGAIYTRTSLSNYAYILLEWDIPKTEASIIVNDSTSVYNVQGKIAVIDDICIASIKMNLIGTNAWLNNAMAIPSEIAPASEICPIFLNIGSRDVIDGTMYDGSYDYVSRSVNVFLPPSSYACLLVMTWKIGV